MTPARATDQRARRTAAANRPAASQRGLAPAMVALQRSVGNRGMARIAARRPTKAQLDSEGVAADYTDAATLISDWHADNYAVLALRDAAEAEATKNYAAFTEIKDPPDLSNAMIAAVFGAITDLIPGAALIKTGITMGVFAHDIRGLKKSLAADDIELDLPEDYGPSEKHKATAEKIHTAYETGQKVGEGAVKVKEAYDQVMERQAAAREATEKANELAELGIKRLSKFEDAIGALRTQREAARGWLADARAHGRHRGGLAALVAEHLGAAPKVGGQEESLTKKLAESFELAFYRAKFGDLFLYRSTTEWADQAVDVNESYFTTGEQYVRNDRYVKYDDLTMAVRSRVAALVGNPGIAYDDLAIAGILGITTTSSVYKDARSKAEVEAGTKALQEQYGSRRRGEV